MPKKKSGSKRKRDKRGHFISKARSAARRTAKPKKRTAKKRKGVVRIKRALGRKRASGKFTRRAKHRVAGYRRKVKGRSAKKLVRSHLSYENPVKRKRRKRATEASMAQANPRRRKRRAPKRRRTAHAVMENPRPRKRRRARRAAPKRRRAMAAYAPNPRKKRRRARRSVTAAVPAVIRRKSGKRGGRSTRSPGRIVVQIAGLGGRRRSSKRKSSSKRRKGSSRRKSGKRVKHRKGYTRKTHQLGPTGSTTLGFFENPIGGNFMENPLSGGELALAAFTGTIGYALTDLLDRYLAVKQYSSTANGVTIQPSAAVRTKPGITRILAQAAAVAVPLGAAYWVKEPMGRAALQGIGIGALMHLGGQLFNHYFMTWVGTKSTMVAPLYQMEVQADSYADAYNGVAPAAGVTPLTGSLAGLVSPRAPHTLGASPTGLGRPNVLRRPAQPSIPFCNPGPFAVAGAPAGVGGCGGDGTGNGDDPTPGSPPGDCAPCGGAPVATPMPPSVDTSVLNGTPRFAGLDSGMFGEE